MRICSFLPSATEIICALGLGNQLVGVTHECDYPPAVKKKAKVIKSVADFSRMNSKTIDKKIRRLLKDGKSIYQLNHQLLKQLKPDVIIGQSTCKVCAPYFNEIDQVRKILRYQLKIIIFHSHTIEQMFKDILILAAELRVEAKGKALVNSIKSEINNVSKRFNINVVKKPKVLCIEWLDPFFTAGHWVPEMVEIAGGLNCISRPSEFSRQLQWSEIIKTDPEILILMPCGFSIQKTMKEIYKLEKNKNWYKLRAVKAKKVYVVNAAAYFSRLGPRISRGIEIMAKIIHRDFEGNNEDFIKIY
jgi:iron complex transport system substrate-binding protein